MAKGKANTTANITRKGGTVRMTLSAKVLVTPTALPAATSCT